MTYSITKEKINKTLDLDDLEKKNYVSIVKEIKELILILTERNLKFTTYQGEFDTGWGENNIWFKRKLWEICTMILYSDIKKEHRVLDCGGASTIFSFYLAHKGNRIDTVDIDWRKFGIVDNANRVAKTMNWNMHNLKADISALPYKDKTFDRVFSISTLEHLFYSEQIRAIKEISRISKSGSIVGLTFDYGPDAFGVKYSDVKALNRRIVIPSNLVILGNRDYQENAWFVEHTGKTWGSLFLQKPGEIFHNKKELLICTQPQRRLKIRILLFLRDIKTKIKNSLRRLSSIIRSSE